MEPRTRRENRFAGSPVYAVETECMWRGTAHVAAVRADAVKGGDDLTGRIALNAALTTAGLAGGATAMPCPSSHPHAITTAGGRAAAVVHRDPDRRVGIHLAPRDSVHARLAGWFTTPGERRRCPFRDPTVLWTLKEAAWQAVGIEALAFHELEIAFTSRGHIRGVRVGGRETPARSAVLLPWPGWLLSVVCLEDAAGGRLS